MSSLICARCGQLPRSVLPGPGHCTCPRDRHAAARKRVAAAHAELCSGRGAVINPADLYHADPDLVAELVRHDRIAVATTTIIYYRAEALPRVLAFWTLPSRNEAHGRD